MIGLGTDIGITGLALRGSAMPTVTADEMVDGAAVSPVTLTIAWPGGVTPESVAAQPSRGVLAVAGGVVTYDPDGAFADQPAAVTTIETGEIIADDGKIYRLRVSVFGAAALLAALWGGVAATWGALPATWGTA